MRHTFSARHALCAALYLIVGAFPGLAGSKVILEPRALPSLGVLDIEPATSSEASRESPRSGPEGEQDALLKTQSARLREELARSGLYRVLDTAPARRLITELRSRRPPLHECESCDLQVGRQLGADQVLVSWVEPASGHRLTLHYDIRDVASGRLLQRRSFDFARGAAGWSQAIAAVVRGLKQQFPPRTSD